MRVLPIGTLPGSGTLAHSLVAPGPLAPTDYAECDYQIPTNQPGTRFSSEPRRTVVLDPGF